MPEPTVIVRMKENVQRVGPGLRLPVIALGDVSVRDRQQATKRKEIMMTHTRYAFIKANWHSDIVDRALDGFQGAYPRRSGRCLRRPRRVRNAAAGPRSGPNRRYGAVACAAFVVDGGIYRHDFVAQAVVDGLMRAGMDTGVPVLSVSLTPHQYQETDHHNAIYRAHFVEKGREAAQAALKITATRASIDPLPHRYSWLGPVSCPNRKSA